MRLLGLLMNIFLFLALALSERTNLHKNISICRARECERCVLLCVAPTSISTCLAVCCCVFAVCCCVYLPQASLHVYELIISRCVLLCVSPTSISTCL